MTGGRDPADLARWTLEHIACFGSKEDPATSGGVMKSAGEFLAARARAESEEREWFERE